MESGSPILTPVSTTLNSPPPLSSAGLSDRISYLSDPNTSYPRLSTLIPNPSGYLAFFSRHSENTSDDEGFNRSSSFRAWKYLRSIKKRLRSYNATLRNKSTKSQASRFAQEYQKPPVGFKLDYAKKEHGGIKTERRYQDRRSKGSHIRCLNKLLCSSEIRSNSAIRGQMTSPIVLVSSKNDPYHNSSFAAGMEETDHCHTHLRKRLSPTLKNQHDNPPTTLLKKVNIGEVKLNDLQSGTGYFQPAHARILDSRAGTASSSTRRVPTQKSVHPALSSGSERHGKVRTSKGIIPKDGYHINGTVVDSSEEAVQTPVVGYPRSRLASSDTARQTSLILNPNEYEYLLKLQGLTSKHDTEPQLLASSDDKGSSHRSDLSESDMNSSFSSSSSTARPIIHGDTTLDNETPTYSSFFTYDPLPAQIRTHGLHVNFSTRQSSTISLSDSSNDQLISSTEGDVNRYQEHIRRSAVKQYNDSPSPAPKSETLSGVSPRVSRMDETTIEDGSVIDEHDEQERYI
ncbi:uncharacterized protein I206_101157 [Kwoniella pini CBS 10737]|uniref:Uncharacterized protein n=1 Tax=Kwoniella pini CBS 10737 TaxID=1296096 RepID=A0A1B9IBC4_9TREE|nr:uncharacterized protein I206_00169 [Kwoniella pini CBS 10737]OCF52869.1 hypothetical protein I206_00169 [Kwoniella pini CBS 10737]